MKVRATLEFDLEDEVGAPVTDHQQFDVATDDAKHLIHRLLGDDLLGPDMLIGSWIVAVSVVEGEVGASDEPP